MKIRWDAMAALIALIGLPFMLSGSATWLIKLMFRRIQRCILVHGSTCERLEWQDIPDGALQEGSPAKRTFEHNDKDCLASSFGKVFQKAWISAQRRDIQVFKPYPLDPTKHYIRTDRKTLEAFVILSGTSIIQFSDTNGILTAHIPVLNPKSRHSGGKLHNRTKHEIAMILEGYPPFYVEKIRVTYTTTVSSPISSTVDTTRGGWILGVGIDSMMTPHVTIHNMEDGYSPPSHWHVEKSPSVKEEWMFTCMSYAVKRFGEVLDKVLDLFPNQIAIQEAIGVFQYLTTKGFNSRSSRPFEFLQYYSTFRELQKDALCYFRDGRPKFPHSCRSKLNEYEWQLAMTAFNHNGPLEPNEIELFQEKMTPILQAGILGLVCVFTVDCDIRFKTSLEKLPSYPELQGRKYIYLTRCEPERKS